MPERERSPIGLAMEWVARITAVALMMFVPGVLGQWLDRQFDTSFLALLGFAFGLVTGVTTLLVMTRSSERR